MRGDAPLGKGEHESFGTIGVVNESSRLILIKLSKRYEYNSIAFAKALTNVLYSQNTHAFVCRSVSHNLLYWYTNL